MRKRIQEWGLRGSRRVLVYKDGDYYEVERYVDGRPKRKRFEDRASAVAWAKRWYDSGLETQAPSLTVRELWRRYMDVVPDQKKWRAATVRHAVVTWKRVEEAIGPDTLVNSVTLATMDEVWAKLSRLEVRGGVMAPNQVRAKVSLFQRVMAWGATRRLVNHIEPAGWEIPETRPRDVPEYRADETDKLLREWDYRDGWYWRPWALVMVMSTHGVRINALLHLTWDDVDLETGRLWLRAPHDKTKREWSRPMTWEAYAAMLTAKWHRDRLGKASPWVFYGKGEKPYTYGAFHMALKAAERDAGITHQPYRAAHGFKRQAVGDARAATGDGALGMLWVNDRDLRQAKSYMKEREDEFQALADRGAE